jgi:outer membrane immunogenic protein
MKRVLLSAAVAMLFMQPAGAADLVLKAKPQPLPQAAIPAGWAGAYAGFQIGYGWSAGGDGTSVTAEFDGPGPLISTATATGDSASAKGWFAGMHAGYNFQRGWLVYGVEGDLQGAGIDGDASSLSATANAPAFRAATAQADIRTAVRWFGTARARIGVTNGPWLLYGTGGLAFGEVALRGTLNATGTFVGGGPPAATTVSSTLNDKSVNVGWVAGFGADYMYTPNVILRIAYQYIDLGRKSSTQSLAVVDPTPGPPDTATASASAGSFAFHTVRGGVSWRL